MKKIRTLLIFAIFAGIALAIYFTSKRRRPLTREGLIDDIKKMGWGSDPGGTLQRMSVQELKDSWELIKATKEGRQVTDAALRARLAVISTKYNVFT